MWDVEISFSTKREVCRPPKNAEIALSPNTRVVKCKYCISQKRKQDNDKIQWYNISVIFIIQFTARL